MKTKLSILSLFLFYNPLVKGQCIAVGPINGSTTANNVSVGTIAWTNSDNALVSDNIYSSASALVLGNNTNYLVVQGFGFSIPVASSICGIVVEFQKNEIGFLGNVTDNSVKIVKAGSIVGNEKASGTTWPAAEAYYTYGASNDLWGSTWISSDINSASFGVTISANLGGVSGLPSAQIDHVRITVYYVSTLPIELLYLKAECAIQGNQINWATATQTNNQYFTIERSNNAIDFETIDSIIGAGTNNQTIQYSIIDSKPTSSLSYYRLKQTDISGQSTYSKLIESTCIYNAVDFILYPNPTVEKMVIKGSGKVSIYNMLGEIIYASNVINNIEIDLSKYVKGSYNVVFDTPYRRLTKKLVLSDFDQ